MNNYNYAALIQRDMNFGMLLCNCELQGHNTPRHPDSVHQ